ncbi:hypothetical protein NCPPB1935_10325 [Xanthomonas campestris pv. nigromaculans]|nr:hypothetical protein CFBP2044_23640 [Xanthomonas hortorum pv. cynarae]CAD0334001.1 hypothetical protein CFBP2044_23640 [Xanthomonas hortorum pv. cynarae]CAH2708151.1 hypothetical protein NCPPB1935_10325 [Xanthomonas campestris pv. nigromaculans]
MPRNNSAHSGSTASDSRATSPDAPNRITEHEDVFFRRLSESRGAEATNGLHWSDLPMQFSLALKCAHIDHCLVGLHGVLEVLHASAAAREGGQPGLSGDLTDRLLYASRALAESGKESLYALQERIAATS